MIGFRHSQVALRTALTQGGTHPFRKQRLYGQANCQKFLFISHCYTVFGCNILFILTFQININKLKIYLENKVSI